MGYVGLLDSECPGKQHNLFTYSDTSETQEKEKHGVNVLGIQDVMLLEKVPASTLNISIFWY